MSRPIAQQFVLDDFLPVSLADSLMSAFESAESSFVQLRGRRCLPLGGRVTSSGLLPADNIPLWLSELMDYVFRIFLAPRNLPRPNHALVNVYAPGEGIMAHEDGPAYTPYATILSVGSSSVFDFVEKSSDRSSRARVYLPVGSLLIFESAAYTDVLHEFKHSIVDDLKEINFSTNDRMGESRLVDSTTLRRGKRISVTMRHVPVVD